MFARELERLGLEPGGDGGTWFQEFPLEETRLDSATRVAIGDRTLAVGRDFLIFPPLPQLGGVGGPFQAAGVPVVYGGKLGDPTLVAPEVAAGKLLLFQPADGPSGWQFWARFGPMQWQRYATANGIVITALDVVPDPVRAFLTGANISLPDTAARRGTVPVMYVSRAVAELMMGGPMTGLLAGTEGGTATAIGGFVRAPARAPARNVVAIVRGTDPVLRSSFVAFGAHNDHDGVQPPQVDHDSLRAYNTIVRPEGAEDMDKQATPAQLESVRALVGSSTSRDRRG